MKFLIIFSFLTFVDGFRVRNVDEEADITISKAKNSINFNKMNGVLYENIKIVYMKFDFDINLVLKEVDDIKMEYKRQNETIEKSIHDFGISREYFSSTYDEMVDLASKIEEAEKNLPKSFVKHGTYINMDGSVMYESEEVINISQKKIEEVGASKKEREGVSCGKPEITNIFSKMFKIVETPLRQYLDIVEEWVILKDIGPLYFSKPSSFSYIDRTVVDIKTAIDQIEDNYKNYEINWRLSEGIMFKQISKGRYEILQKIILTSPDNTHELWSRDTFPMVYQNILLDIEETSRNYLAIQPKRKEFGLVSYDFLHKEYIREEEDNGFVTIRPDPKKCVKKGWDYLCRRTIKTFPITKLSETCEGALLQANGPKIRELCDRKFAKLRLESKNVGPDVVLYNPEPIVATMDCNEKIVKKWNKVGFRLEGLQRLSIPEFCTLKTSKYEISGFSPFFAQDGIQIHYNETGLETIWPELTELSVDKSKTFNGILDTITYQIQQLLESF